MHAQTRPTLYEQLAALPVNLTGENLDGRLYTQPRPAWPHALAASSLGDELVGPFQKGQGGPGGWWIIDEPELHFIRDAEVDVPDLAGWRRERMPRPTLGHRIEVVSDWVCEILSPSAERKDRTIKMPIYARFGVDYAWLIDPLARTLEAYALAGGGWQDIGRYAGNAAVTVAPFDAISIRL
ncbi:Uma2 family endonuclease [uncultured Thiodictyon sp.]|uniref:Uma2 family endonuclease n=1 Tax=uncultured Thiodictyon sp. TaxID=1846217 RepID=UPI0025FD3EEE|nr:Uma2 family endonuclease [uncultured Thiodictyon sp.]